MIAALIRGVDRNRFLVLLATLAPPRGETWRRSHAAPNQSRPFRRASDHPHDLPGQAPQVVENQITYPLPRRASLCPGPKRARLFILGDCSYTSLFEDGTDPTGRARGCSNT